MSQKRLYFIHHDTKENIFPTVRIGTPNTLFLCQRTQFTRFRHFCGIFVQSCHNIDICISFKSLRNRYFFPFFKRIAFRFFKFQNFYSAYFCATSDQTNRIIHHRFVCCFFSVPFKHNKLRQVRLSHFFISVTMTYLINFRKPCD